jgi:histidinol-phosphate aminotransferase
LSDGDPIRALLRPELAGLHAYQTPDAPAAIRLDANESPWPMPEHARARIAEELASIDLHRYPDPRCTELRGALAGYCEADPDELVIGAGSDELIAILATALARPREGAERAVVLHPEPSFSMYGIIAGGRGLDAVRVPLDARFDLDVDAMKRAIDAHRPAIVFVASPNNPTGNALDERAILAVVEHARESLVVLDEAYVEFASRPMRQHFAAHDNVAIMGTLSKIGLAALRVGWIRVRPWLARELEKVRLPYNVPLPSQRLAVLALGELRETIRAHVRAIRNERASLIARLAEIPGLTPWPTDANFVLVEVAAPGATALAARLHASGIEVRSFPRHPRLAHFVRITVGTPDESAALIAAAKR